MKLFCFDLSPQFSGSSVGAQSHALHTSPFRGVIWASLQGPLLGTIRWLGVASNMHVSPRPSSQSDLDARWSLVGAVGCFMLVTSAQQAMQTATGVQAAPTMRALLAPAPPPRWGHLSTASEVRPPHQPPQPNVERREEKRGKRKRERAI